MGSDLFSGITFKLNKGDRVGLIGKNGAGKSTLLKVLSKDIESSGGTMAFDKDIQIGFLRQDIDFVAGFDVVVREHLAEWDSTDDTRECVSLVCPRCWVLMSLLMNLI